MKLQTQSRIEIRIARPIHPPRRGTEPRSGKSRREVNIASAYGIQQHQLTPIKVAQSRSS
jgi:hypothetical protein